MNLTIKIVKRTLIAFGALALLSVTGFAQGQITSGTGTLSGTIAKSVQLTSGGTASITGNLGGAAPTSAGQGLQLTATIDFGDISPNNTTANPYVTATIPVQLRSNCPYTFTLQRGGGLTASSQGTFGAGDVGVSINNIATTGDGVLTSTGAVSGASVTSGFSSTNANAGSIGTVTNGNATYTGSLSGVSTSTATTLIAGSRISNGGDNTSVNNAITFKLNFLIHPQYFGPTTSFSETLTLGIVAP